MDDLGASDRDWQQEARVWRARAEHLQAAVDRLRSLAVAGESVGFLAHELNNLYTPVVGYCHAAQAPGADEVVRTKAIAKSLAAAERVGDLAEAILQLSGSAAEATKLTGRCDLAEAVETALLVLGVERWEREGVRVGVNVPRGTLVGVRPGVVQQVVMNLVLNARRAMEGRRGIIEVRGAEAGGIVRMDVVDRGSGMKTEVMMRLFDITSIDNSYRVDVQELMKSGSLNGQARWGVKVKGGTEAASGGSREGQVAGRESRAANGEREEETRPDGREPARARKARNEPASRAKIGKLSAGKVAPSMSPIKVWDAGEVAAELRSVATGLPASPGPQDAHGAEELRGGEEALGTPSAVPSGGKVANAEARVSSGGAAPEPRGGSGLGLALCLELVGRVGGRMSAESVVGGVGEGTTVRVEWPGIAGAGKRAA